MTSQANSDTMALASSPRRYASYQIISLAEWCRSNDFPYVLIADTNTDDEKTCRFPGVAAGQSFKYSRPPIFAGRVDNVRILPPAGYMTTNDMRVVFQGLIGTDVLPELNLGPYFGRIDQPDRFILDVAEGGAAVEQECIYIGGHPNFGHFLYENLARLATLNWFPALQSMPIAVYDDLPRRYYEFLDLYGYPAARRLTIPRSAPTRFARVWRLSSPMYRKSRTFLPLIWPDAIWALRSGAAHLMRPMPARRPRYFLLRTGIQWRRLLNEPQVLAVLRNYGVEPIDLASMSAAAQIETISEAELVVSVAGAGPAITLYAPADCLMIELTVPRFKPVFSMYGYAAILEQPVARLFGRRIEAGSLPGPSLRPEGKKFAADADFEIDIDELKRLVEAADAHLTSKSGSRPASANQTGGLPPQRPEPESLPHVGSSIFLRDLCATDKQPFREIAAGNYPPSRVLRATGTPERRWIPYHRHGAMAGRVTDAVATPNSGCLSTMDGAVIRSAGIGQGVSKAARSPSDIGKIERRVTDDSIFLGGSTDLGEFITGHLLQLTLLNWLPDLQGLPIAVYDDVPRAAIDLLTLFGFDESLMVSIPRSKAVRFDRAWLLSSPIEPGTTSGPPSLWPESLWAARSRLAYLGKPIVGARPRVYLKSSRSDRQALGNFEQFEALFRNRGLEPLDIDSHGIRHGLETLSNAEMLVVPPGTIGALGLFAAGDCTVIELTSTKSRDVAGPLEVASVLGQSFIRAIGQTRPSSAAMLADLDSLQTHEQVVIDMANVEQILDATIAQCEAKAALRPSSLLRARSGEFRG